MTIPEKEKLYKPSTGYIAEEDMEMKESMLKN